MPNKEQASISRVSASKYAGHDGSDDGPLSTAAISGGRVSIMPTRETVLARRTLAVSFLFLATAGSSVLRSEVKEVLRGVQFDESVVTVRAKLESHCDRVSLVTVDSPAFPLAENSETHLICEGFDSGESTIDEVALVFADDRLVMIEARGGAVAVLRAAASGDSMKYLDFEVYRSDLMFANVEEDAVWLLTQDALHPNLFSWSNPHLPSNQSAKYEYARSARSPDVLVFGGKLEDLAPELAEQCASTQLQEIAEPWLETNPEKQVQIDCFGFEYAGFPRKIEAVFGDGVLQLAWILTGKGEEDRVRQALIESYGRPIFVDHDWEVFENWRIMLRKDKPEVLVLSEELAPTYRKRLQPE